MREGGGTNVREGRSATGEGGKDGRRTEGRG
jgi:hypothetical protein